MRGAIPPLPKYAFMEWCSFKKKIRPVSERGFENERQTYIYV
jgi:hypothetical protein